jgi:hypothetical protein
MPAGVNRGIVSTNSKHKGVNRDWTRCRQLAGRSRRPLRVPVVGRAALDGPGFSSRSGQPGTDGCPARTRCRWPAAGTSPAGRPAARSTWRRWIRRNHGRSRRRTVQRERGQADREPELEATSGAPRRALHGAPGVDGRLPGQRGLLGRGRRGVEVHQEGVDRRGSAVDEVPRARRRVPRRAGLRRAPAEPQQCRAVDQRQERARLLVEPRLEHRAGEGRQHRRGRAVQHDVARDRLGGVDDRRSAGGAQRGRGADVRRHQCGGGVVGKPADAAEDELQGGR